MVSPPRPITRHDRLEAFDCGRAPLNEGLKVRALDNEGRASRTYVVVASDGPHTGEVVGYYILATGSVALREIHRKYRHNLPNSVPILVLGRLAVDHRHHGKRLGQALLAEAMRRTLDIAKLAGVRMLMVHAIDDDTIAFYSHYGFHIFPAGRRTMFLPVETIAEVL